MMAIHLATHFRDRTGDGLCVNLLWPRRHGVLGPWSKQIFSVYLYRTSGSKLHALGVWRPLQPHCRLCRPPLHM